MWKLPFGNIKSQQKNLFSGWKLGQKYVLLSLFMSVVPMRWTKYLVFMALQKNRMNGMQ